MLSTRGFNRVFDKKLTYIVDEKGRKLNIFALALPLFFEGVSSILMGLVQSILSSRFMGGFFVIPINVANSVLSIFTAVTFVPTFGLSILLSVNIGKKNYDVCKKLIGNALVILFGISFISALICLFFSEGLLSVMGMNTPEYAVYTSYAVEYLRYRAVITLLLHWFIILTMALRCFGHSAPGFIVTLALNVINAVLTAVVFYVLKTPKEMVIKMLALSLAIATFIALTIAIVAFIKHGLKMDLRPSFRYIKQILRVGFPSALTNIAFTLSQTITTRICISISPLIYQTKLYSNQILNFSYLLGANFGKANGILIGRLYGMGDFETPSKMTRQNLRLVFVINLTISLSLALLSAPLMRGLFAASDEMIKWARIIFFIDILVELGRAFGHVGEGVLDASGDTMFKATVSMLSCWMIGVFMAFVAVEYLSLGIVGMWIALAVDESTRGLCFLTRWKREKWKKNFEKKTSV